MKRAILLCMAILLAITLCACTKQSGTPPTETTASSGTSTAGAASPPASTQNENTSETNGDSDGRGDLIDDEQDGRGDLFDDYPVPVGADDEIRQEVFYYELIELEGDPGEGLSPREGAELVDGLLASIGLYSGNGIPSGKCVYISFDDLMFLDSAMGRECYIYSSIT